ncbi:MAG: S-layer family protein [Cyanobacteria bacterium P01_F01_bin.53]
MFNKTHVLRVGVATIGAGIGTGLPLLSMAPGMAQVIPDGTLPNNSETTRVNLTTTITGGTRSGDALFHSFEDFQIPAGETVRFDNATDLSTLVTRVSGPLPSAILGQLASTGSADFFLLNPNGITFGENAQLNVGGSFIASTAEQLLFEGGAVFSARSPQSPPMLAMSAPIGLQYGTNPGDIVAVGNGNGFRLDPDTLEVLSTQPRDGLAVSADQTLALLGGNVILDGGNLTAGEGRVVLGGFGSGEIQLDRDDLGWSLSLSSLEALDAEATETGLISLGFASSVVTSGDRGGDIQLFGQVLEVLEGSALLANTLGEGRPQNGMPTGDLSIVLTATEEIFLSGARFENSPNEDVALFPTSLFAEVGFDATGQGGDIALRAPIVAIEAGAQVSTSVFGKGAGGDISVEGETVSLFGGTRDFSSSGLYSAVADFEATGPGGDITVRANQLTIAGGATIDGSTFGPGNAGQINLRAEAVDIVGGAAGLGPSGVASQTEGDGQGGNVRIEGDRVSILGGAELSSNAVFGQGSGGRLEVVADQLTLSGTSPSGLPSNLSSLLAVDSQGRGGEIDLRVGQLEVANGAEVRSTTFGIGPGGKLGIQAQSVNLVGTDDASTGLFAAVEAGARGTGGEIAVNADQLAVEDGAQIVTGTLGAGPAGNLRVSVNQVQLSGGNNTARSGLFASALLGAGTGGSVTLDTERLAVSNGATINASNFASTVDGPPPGQGAAGNINIRAGQIQLRDRAQLTTDTLRGDRGNISIQSDVITLADRSTISANASETATGGNINISTGFLITRPEANSDITANAVQGQGGRVQLSAQQVFGIEFRPELTSQSDITVSSTFGQSGEVFVELTDADATDDLGSLPETVLPEDQPIAAGCLADQGTAFVASGRGGLPDNLSQQMQPASGLPAFERSLNPTVLEATDLGPTDPETIERQQRTTGLSVEQLVAPPIAEQPIVEATSWARNEQGEITLLAHERNQSDQLLAAGVCLRRTV